MQHSLVSECFALDLCFSASFEWMYVFWNYFLVTYLLIISCWLINSSFSADVSFHAQASNPPNHICPRPSVSLEGLDWSNGNRSAPRLSNGNRSAPRLSNGTQVSYVCCLLAAHNQATSSTGRPPSDLVSLASSSFPQFCPGVCRSWNGLLVSWFCLREWKCVFCLSPIYFALGASLKHQITGWCK